MTLSSLPNNEIHALLKPFHHASTEHVFYACQRMDVPDTRLPVYVRRNRSTWLSLARVPRSGNECHRSCRDFDIAAEDAARLGYDNSVPAVDEEGNQVVALSESLRNSAGAREPRASVVRLGPRANTVQLRPACSTGATGQTLAAQVRVASTWPSDGPERP